jgi:hypothetical protein
MSKRKCDGPAGSVVEKAQKTDADAPPRGIMSVVTELSITMGPFGQAAAAATAAAAVAATATADVSTGDDDDTDECDICATTHRVDQLDIFHDGSGNVCEACIDKVSQCVVCEDLYRDDSRLLKCTFCRESVCRDCCKMTADAQGPRARYCADTCERIQSKNRCRVCNGVYTQKLRRVPKTRLYECSDCKSATRTERSSCTLPVAAHIPAPPPAAAAAAAAAASAVDEKDADPGITVTVTACMECNAACDPDHLQQFGGHCKPCWIKFGYACCVCGFRSSTQDTMVSCAFCQKLVCKSHACITSDYTYRTYYCENACTGLDDDRHCGTCGQVYYDMRNVKTDTSGFTRCVVGCAEPKRS